MLDQDGEGQVKDIVVTQLDDISPFYWDLSMDHLCFQHPENTELNIVQLCASKR